MPNRTFALTLLAAALSLTSGCGGGGAAIGDPICVAAPAPPILVYPLNDATGVPDGNFSLEVTGPPNPVSLEIGNTIAISDIPPSSAFSAASLSGYNYQVPALQPATTYTVIALIPRSGCYDPSKVPSTIPGAIGSFTTK